MGPEDNDLRERTKPFGLRLVRMFSRLPKKQRPKYSASRSYDRVLPSEQTIARHIAPAANPNGATGASDMDGKAAR